MVDPAVGDDKAERATDPGTQFALVDLGICPVGDAADLAPEAFLVRTDDGHLWESWEKRIPARSPDLSAQLGPQARGCLRGWLTYEIKTGNKVTEVLFAPRRAGAVRWLVR